MTALPAAQGQCRGRGVPAAPQPASPPHTGWVGAGSTPAPSHSPPAPCLQPPHPTAAPPIGSFSPSWVQMTAPRSPHAPPARMGLPPTTLLLPPAGAGGPLPQTLLLPVPVEGIGHCSAKICPVHAPPESAAAQRTPLCGKQGAARSEDGVPRPGTVPASPRSTITTTALRADGRPAPDTRSRGSRLAHRWLPGPPRPTAHPRARCPAEGTVTAGTRAGHLRLSPDACCFSTALCYSPSREKNT